MTEAESRWLQKVKQAPCCICMFRLGQRTPGQEAHHAGERRNHFYVASLCTEHHRGATGVHGLHRRRFQDLWKATDEQLVAWTIQLVEESACEPFTAF